MIRSTLIKLTVLIFITSACNQSYQGDYDVIDLSGVWDFQLDPDNVGIEDKWYGKEFTDSIKLPGTTDENHKGTYLDERAVERLSRVWFWEGSAWYQKEVEIPEDWEGKSIKLLLERTKDTYVWVDDVLCGYENTLSTIQYFDLTEAAKPGMHTITVLVNNAKLPPVGNSFAFSEKTQTNWNGIVGRIELQANDPVWIDNVQVYPDIQKNGVKIRLTLGNITNQTAEGEITAKAESWNTNDIVKLKEHKETINKIENNEVIELFYEFNKQVPLWDEFDPAMIKLNLNLSAQAGEHEFISSKQVDFGMREITSNGKFMLVNGNRIFLRGRVDCANYPLTGYPPMKKEEWVDLYMKLKSYGINHWRFHSWFPPEAALEAADEVGIYLQPELPNQSYDMDAKSFDSEEIQMRSSKEFPETDSYKFNPTLAEYLKREGELIFQHFGNHPSFIMFTLGNELGRNQPMFELIEHFKEIDPRRLYAQGSNNMALSAHPARNDDFWVTARSSPKYGIRGSFAIHLRPEVNPHIEYFPPTTLHTYTKAIENVKIPIISHEVGQFQVSPDFNDIPKFTGVTRARNFEIFRERLKNANMLEQADDFVKASGKLAVICYREEVEAALRTPDFTGFQLLDIQDYPGQGTALVGILNDFMESKGLVSPKEWSRFCNEVVPLFKMGKFTWTNNEMLTGEIEIAHYGKEDFPNAYIQWKIINSKREVLYERVFENMNIPRGGLSSVGNVSFPLKGFDAAEKIKLIIGIEGTSYENEYDIWVYPEAIDIKIPDGVIISERLDPETVNHLEKGGKAIIIPDHDKLKHCLQGAFQTDFWCYPMFLRGALKRGTEPAPGTMGFILDPNHPLVSDFPTEFHSNWQWWHLAKNCKPIILDSTPAEYKPLIQTIDNFHRNHKLGMVFETKYGEGSALICAIDLLNLQDKPEARQFYYSMLNYVKSDEFSPETELEKEFLMKILSNVASRENPM